MNEIQDILFPFIRSEEARKRLQASGDRISRAFEELFAGYKLSAEDVLNEVVRVENYTGLVTVEHINFYSYCEHHFAPFFGTAAVTYDPGEIITGLGKIVRLVRDVHARRLQIQETMTRDIAEDMMRVLKAKGVHVVTTAKHLCICSRGPSDDTSETIVSYAVGSLRRLLDQAH
ncbi:MAG: GTP cyclohydrolase I [Opitutaceae bacterium]|nr:GTP cyclohydrolase I [Opitutaceae bacterium]